MSLQSEAEWAEDDRKREIEDQAAYRRVLGVIEEMKEHCPEGSHGWFYWMKLQNAVDGRE